MTYKNAEIAEFDPRIWYHFVNLSAVPRGTYKEKKVRQFIIDFAISLNLKWQKDDFGNILVYKDATKGMANRATVAIQSHLDMVHEKNDGIKFNFDTDGIKLLIENGWVTADGTTLGADNGIGVATIMAILESTHIPHPRIEALFTATEEDGLKGAHALTSDFLSAPYLINLDSSNVDEICNGCAGGATIKITTSPATTVAGGIVKKIMIRGLEGGHSGTGIHFGRANANKILARLLEPLFLSSTFRIMFFEGGDKKNAIPREAMCILSMETEHNVALLDNAVIQMRETIASEYGITDPKASITVEDSDFVGRSMTKDHSSKFCRLIHMMHDGVFKNDGLDRSLVQTSSTVSVVKFENGKTVIINAARGSIGSELEYLVEQIKLCAKQMNYASSVESQYPGWPINHSSKLTQVASDIYKGIHGTTPTIKPVHAGLECGIISSKYPKMDMISIGPNLKALHSPDEKVEIESVTKYWNYLQEILKNIPLLE